MKSVKKETLLKKVLKKPCARISHSLVRSINLYVNAVRYFNVENMHVTYFFFVDNYKKLSLTSDTVLKNALLKFKRNMYETFTKEISLQLCKM